MTAANGAVYHAEVVGSLLRPPELVEARQAMRAGNLAPGDYAAIEDRAVDEALRIQEEAGVDVVTDGEMRRDVFFDLFIRGFTGLSMIPGIVVRFHGDQEETAMEFQIPFTVTERITAMPCPALAEFAYARQHTDKPIKVTLPSPTMSIGFYNDHSKDAYPDPLELVSDAAEAVRGWMRELADAGCRYIQIDAPEVAELYADESIRADYRSRGIDVEALMDLAGESVASLGAVELPGVTKALHVCKGNGTQSWIAEGGYEALSEQVFRRASGFDVFHLEYDDDRSGGFEPLANLPDDKMAVLGLVSTKWTELEDPDDLRRRIDDAARFHPKERLALATQCGFASAAETAEERKITDQTQRDKLKLVADVAHSVWS